MAAAPTRKKFANSNLNAVLGGPKAASNPVGPSVRSATVVKPVAKPKGLVALGKAPSVTITGTVRKGSALAQFEERAKALESVAKKDEVGKPEWAELDYDELEKTLSKPEAEHAAEAGGEDVAASKDDETKRADHDDAVGDGGDAGRANADVHEKPRKPERPPGKAHRSALSMEYIPGPSAPSAPPDEPPPPEHLAGRAKLEAAPAMEPPKFDRSRSWADQTEMDEMWAPPEMAPPARPGGVGGRSPPPTGPPPARRAPPPSEPPPAETSGGHRRPACPPPATPPPAGPPHATVHLGSVAGRSARGEERRATPAGAPPGHGQLGGRGALEGRHPGAAPPPVRGGKGGRHDEAEEHLPGRWRDGGHGKHAVGAAGGPAEHRDRPPPPRGAGGPVGGAPRPQVPPQRPAAPPQQPPPIGGPPRPPQPEGGAGYSPSQSCWGPAVVCTPAFAPRSPIADRPMSEDFVNSGWKEKKLWTPHEEDERARAAAAGQKSKGTRGIAGTLEAANRVKEAAASPAAGEAPPVGGKPPRAGAAAPASPAGEGGKRGAAPAAEVPPAKEPAPAAKPSKPPKAAREKKGPLDVLDPESSASEDDSDSPAIPPEYAVLDMNVPRTAMVINVSHVLKRLSGCCSLNQLTKALKSFKENTGVTLEQFLRANPDSFKLEGRIVFLVDRNGEKWRPPQDDTEYEGKGKRKGGKGEARPAGKGAAGGAGAGGGKGAGVKVYKQQEYHQPASQRGQYRGKHDPYYEESWDDDSWWGAGWSANDWGSSGGWAATGGSGGSKWRHTSW